MQGSHDCRANILLAFGFGHTASQHGSLNSEGIDKGIARFVCL